MGNLIPEGFISAMISVVKAISPFAGEYIDAGIRRVAEVIDSIFLGYKQLKAT